MKKVIFFLIFVTVIIANFHLKQNIVAKDIYTIIQKIVPSPVIATINENCNIYVDSKMESIITQLEKGTNVEILQDRNKKIYFVKNSMLNIEGWLKREDLYIPKTPIANTNYLEDKELEAYVNYLGLDSDTKYLMFTDIYRQLTYIFKGKCQNWKLIKTISCGTGVNESPTVRGIFKIVDKGDWFYSERFNSGAMYWLKFNGSYLYHSVSMDKNKNVIDNTVGQRCSNGCVRMTLDDIKWVYDNIEKGTTVYIN